MRPYDPPSLWVPGSRYPALARLPCRSGALSCTGVAAGWFSLTLGPVAEGVVVGGVVAGLGEASGVSRVVSSHHVIKPEASGVQDRRTR